jgi:hypothetical protein
MATPRLHGAHSNQPNISVLHHVAHILLKLSPCDLAKAAAHAVRTAAERPAAQ